MNFIVMDFETASHHPESACSLALVVIRNSKTIDRFYVVINPQMPFDGRSVQVHQIIPDDVKDAPTMTEVWPKIETLYQPGMLVVAYNTKFDANVLKTLLTRCDIDEPHYLVTDTLKTSRLFELDLSDHRLNTVAEALNVEPWYHHNALSDSEACAGILTKQNGEVGSEAIKSLAEQR